MARIRTIKPEFFANEEMSTCSPHARLLAIAVLQLADSAGRFRYIPMQLHAHAFPWEATVKVQTLLGELQDIGYLDIYENDGKQYGVIHNFGKHQRLSGKEAQTESGLPELVEEKQIVRIGKQQGKKERFPEKHLDAQEREREREREREKRDTSFRGEITETSVSEISNAPASSVDDGFQEFWDAYPKKVEKKKSLDIWKRKKLVRMASHIASDVKTRSERDQNWRDGYIPNPPTYLNGERWEDEIATKANGNGASKKTGRESAADRAAWQAAHDEKCIKRRLG